MGFWKNIMIEAQGRGNWVPDRMESYICAHHYEDSYLKAFIKKNSAKGKCSFCGRETEVCDMYDFMMYAADGFYASTDRKTGERNVVLFCNQQESRRLVGLVSVGA